MKACCEKMQPYLDKLIELGEEPVMTQKILHQIHDKVSKVMRNMGEFEYRLPKLFEDAIVFDNVESKEVFIDCAYAEAEEDLLQFNSYAKAKILKMYVDGLKQSLSPVEIDAPEDYIESEDESNNKEFTMPRQVLAIHYLLEYCKVKNVDNTVKADFVKFLTGRNKNLKNLYDAVRNPLSTKEGNLRFDDLQYVRTYFENLGISEIVKMINNELDKPHS